jgi:MFS family permease
MLMEMSAFACYTIATTFGPQVAGTLSGYIAATAPWPVYFWWTVAALGLVCILFFFFIEDTTFDRTNASSKKAKLPFVQERVATLLPGSAVVQSDGSYLGFLDSIIIGVQPVSLCAGFFLMATFGWAVAVTTLLR